MIKYNFSESDQFLNSVGLNCRHNDKQENNSTLTNDLYKNEIIVSTNSKKVRNKSSYQIKWPEQKKIKLRLKNKKIGAHDLNETIRLIEYNNADQF